MASMSEAIPGFLERMNAVFASERSNQFLLVGNIHDLVDARSLGGTEAFLPVINFLLARLASRDHTPIRYDIGQGLRFYNAKDERMCRKAFVKHTHADENLFNSLITRSRSDQACALQFLAELCQLPLKKPVSVVIEYAELLFPATDAAHMHDGDRRRLALMRDWLGDPRFHAHRGALFLVAETAASIHQHIRTMPQVMCIDVPLPDQRERLEFIQWIQINDEQLHLGDTPERLATFTAGMSLTDIRSLCRDARWAKESVSRSRILAEVNRLLAARIGDHIELVEPSHNLNDVIGQSALKIELEKQQQLMDLDDSQLSPVGILVAGPNGAGKTYIYSAWAASCNRLVVHLKNLRGSYYGETDRIFEQVRGVLEALGKVIVFIDEADTQFGKPDDQTHETEARLFGSLINMMGDPHNRGRIIWVLLTSRPERLAPDLKRSGRAGLHLPVFDPEGKDRDAFIRHALAQANIDIDGIPADSRVLINQRTAHFAPADFNELAQYIRAENALGHVINNNMLVGLLENMRPVDIASQRRVQTLQALLHCSRNNIIPESLRELNREGIELELEHS